MRRQGLTLTAMVGTVLVAGAFLMAPLASASTAAASSAADFRSAANAICQESIQARSNTLLKHFPDGGKKTPTTKQITAFVKDYQKVVQKQIDALAKLKPPSNLAPKMSKLLSTARKALAKVWPSRRC